MSDLVGRWRILRWEQVYDDGRRQLPMGDNLVGFLQYDADGRMVVMLARADRPGFTTGGQWDASDFEKAAAYQSMLTYAGTWERDGDDVVHRVELSLYPGWVGGVQRRHLVFGDDGTVSLEARIEEGTSEARTAALQWRREEGQA